MNHQFKNIRTVLLALMVLFVFISCENEPKQIEENSPSIIEKNKQLRHIVLFKFNEEATPSDIKKVEDGFLNLPSKIEEIKEFEWGLNNSPEGLDKGFTHCFMVTFNGVKERDIYLPHPDHLAFVEVLKPHVQDALVVDYFVE